MILAEKIKKYARRQEVNIVGIAPVARFTQAPAGLHPKDILPGARSVIVLGNYFPRGALQTKARGAVRNTYLSSFAALDHCAYRLACQIEKHAELAVPVRADCPYPYYDEEKQIGKGELSHKHAAVLAGLGVLGKSSLLLIPEYGNRINLVSVVTTAALEGDPLYEGTLCPENCRLCIDACPAGAIKDSARVDQKQCRKYENWFNPEGIFFFGCWECRRVCPVPGVFPPPRG